ncbi:MAG: type II toxin-antitoxin system PemK/MazF family toxin [Azospirillum sp.]|nr:type II toxin-antitoxin system PemK/MazF family toxin [Azospirillum sp.]
MTQPFPTPEPGLVFRYRYLWTADSVETSPKPRPVLAISVDRLADGNLRVVVAPISSRRPTPGAGIAIPAATNSRLRLDADESWIVASETNVFTWPGYDLEQTPDGKWSYGFVGQNFVSAAQSILLGPPPAPRTERDDVEDIDAYRSAKPSISRFRRRPFGRERAERRLEFRELLGRDFGEFGVFGRKTAA